MYELTSKLVVYRGLEPDSILMKLADIYHRYDMGERNLSGEVLTQITRLLDVSTKYGFNHNLWHNYLAYVLAMTETPFTLVSEKSDPVDGSVNTFVRNDLSIFKQLFDFDFSQMERDLNLNCFSVIQDYHAVTKKEQVYNKSVSEKVQELSREIEEAEDVDAVYAAVTGFYKKYGVGKLGLNKAFRVGQKEDEDLLVPITNTGDMQLQDIIGYELQKKRLIENTEAFVQGRKANNVLLYGDAGTGKSTSIKAILNQYYPDGLRMIEVYKHQFKQLSEIINEIKNRNYRFIIYMDDLSFEEFEIEYKYLKAVIEGGLEPKPDNVLIYATSNRRHLIRETWHDKQDASKDDLHKNDTVQEKLSLSARFGVQIGYFKPTPKEFQEIVEGLAARNPDLKISKEELLRQANAWEMQHGGFSGRTAKQFIDYLLGQNAE
ncbi:MAG: ATP-binding protein [Lachnospiraceae bacterium]|nr:ATP-binding protein [Lachnospiraceae bacterium]